MQIKNVEGQIKLGAAVVADGNATPTNSKKPKADKQKTNGATGGVNSGTGSRKIGEGTSGGIMTQNKFDILCDDDGEGSKMTGPGF